VHELDRAMYLFSLHLHPVCRSKISRVSWWQGALLAMAMVLVQQPTQRTAEFRTRIAKLAADKHEEIMCRCGWTLWPFWTLQVWLLAQCC
jgi:hypothetical protein